MACPNINSPQWKDLVSKIGVFEAMREFIKNGEEIPDAANYQETFSGINATLKVVGALQKMTRNSYPSNQVQGFYNDLIKLGTPKNQLDLLKDHIERNNIKQINVNDLIVSILSEMNYTIEINTATTSLKRDYDEGYEFSEEELMRGPQSEDLLKKPRPTTYYANLTVPGGTNYTENEIATPAIVPSIKGHAQFSTDNGIGWFRSDDKHPFTGFLEDLIASGTIKKAPCE